MQTDVILVAPAGDFTPDTGDLEGVVDLSSFSGDSDPRQLRLDHSRIVLGTGLLPARQRVDSGLRARGPALPAMGPVGVIVTLALLGIASFYFLTRRRRRTT